MFIMSIHVVSAVNAFRGLRNKDIGSAAVAMTPILTHISNDDGITCMLLTGGGNLYCNTSVIPAALSSDLNFRKTSRV
jgi:hypothetical protein